MRTKNRPTNFRIGPIIEVSHETGRFANEPGFADPVGWALPTTEFETWQPLRVGGWCPPYAKTDPIRPHQEPSRSRREDPWRAGFVLGG